MIRSKCFLGVNLDVKIHIDPHTLERAASDGETSLKYSV
jgi:hypothetical protein